AGRGVGVVTTVSLGPRLRDVDARRSRLGRYEEGDVVVERAVESHDVVFGAGEADERDRLVTGAVVDLDQTRDVGDGRELVAVVAGQHLGDHASHREARQVHATRVDAHPRLHVVDQPQHGGNVPTGVVQVPDRALTGVRRDHGHPAAGREL